MRRSIIATVILFNSTKHSLAFPLNGSSAISFIDKTHTVSNYNVRKVVTLHMTEEEKKLTAADILARARKAVNRSSNAENDEGKDESAILFDDSLMNDMKYCLVALEKRVKEGPGSLTVQEIQGISDASTRIVRDMNINTVIEQKSSSSSATTLVPPSPPTESLSTVVPADSFNDDTTVVTPVADLPAPPDTITSLSDPGDEVEYVETSDEEGAQYDGKGGLGLAKGTRNTYIIPGMDEMSPEEYRKALQESVLNRQKLRHRKRDGLVGNRAALQYLDQLNWGGASSNWKTE